MSRIERLLLATALGYVVTGSFLQRWVPMTRWKHLLGSPRQVSPAERATIITATTSSSESQVAKAIGRASSVLPWTVTCLAQAFGGQRLLERFGHPSAVVIGVKPGDSERWPSHAWLVSEGKVITGAEGGRGYSPVSAFGSDEDEGRGNPRPGSGKDK